MSDKVKIYAPNFCFTGDRLGVEFVDGVGMATPEQAAALVKLGYLKKAPDVKPETKSDDTLATQLKMIQGKLAKSQDTIKAVRHALHLDKVPFKHLVKAAELLVIAPEAAKAVTAKINELKAAKKRMVNNAY